MSTEDPSQTNLPPNKKYGDRSLNRPVSEFLLEINRLTEERDRAIKFANQVEWADSRFKKVCDEQLERISKMPLDKTIHESLSESVERVLKERNELKAILKANAKLTASLPEAES